MRPNDIDNFGPVEKEMKFQRFYTCPATGVINAVFGENENKPWATAVHLPREKVIEKYVELVVEGKPGRDQFWDTLINWPNYHGYNSLLFAEIIEVIGKQRKELQKELKESSKSFHALLERNEELTQEGDSLHRDRDKPYKNLQYSVNRRIELAEALQLAREEIGKAQMENATLKQRCKDYRDLYEENQRLKKKLKEAELQAENLLKYIQGVNR